MDDLKKYALEKALTLGGKPTDIIDAATAFYNFLNPAVKTNGHAVSAPPPVRPLAALDLPKMRREVLKEAIRLSNAGETINARTIHTGCGISQSMTSNHLNALIKSGHIKRQGNKYWPALLPNGDPYIMPITKVPEGFARGYKPATQKIGNIGRVN